MALIICPECGREISDKAVNCPGCGYKTEGIVRFDEKIIQYDEKIFQPSEIEPHEKKVTLLFCIFLGYFGGHRFYQKRYGTAVLMLVFGVSSFAALDPLIPITWWIIDLVMICNDRFFLSYNKKMFYKNENMKRKEVIDNRYNQNPLAFEPLIMEIYYKNNNELNAARELEARTGMSSQKAYSIMERRFKGLDMVQKGYYYSKQQKIEEKKQQKRESRENLQASINAFQSAFGSSKVTRCPKCRSTQITYGGNRPSVGRALIGGAVAGGAGAAIGGLTGKKGYAICLNCGKRWKI